MKKNKIRFIALVTLLIVIGSTFCGCFINSKYDGPNPELCSVAWANLVDVYGYWSNGEIGGPVDVEIIETDSYGRVLFTYTEEHYYPETKPIYLLVMQYSDDENVFYYPEDCYIYLEAPVVDRECVFDTDVINELKLLNDWECPMDKSKCDSTKIVREKPEGEIKNGTRDWFLEDIVEEYHKRSGRYIHPKNVSFVNSSSFIVKDDYGREMYIVYTHFEEYTDKVMTRYSYKFLIVLTPDEECDVSTVILLEDSQNAQADVKQIKEQNGWNKPLE